MTPQLWLWLGCNAFVLVMLALDLGVFHRKAHVVSFHEAIGWSITWITLARPAAKPHSQPVLNSP